MCVYVCDAVHLKVLSLIQKEHFLRTFLLDFFRPLRVSQFTKSPLIQVLINRSQSSLTQKPVIMEELDHCHWMHHRREVYAIQHTDLHKMICTGHGAASGMSHHFVPIKGRERRLPRVTAELCWRRAGLRLRLLIAPCPQARQLIYVPLRILEPGLAFASTQAQRLSCSHPRSDQSPLAAANLARTP